MMLAAYAAASGALPSMIIRLSSLAMRSLVAEIVRSGHDHRILAERIEHDHLAVDVNAASQHFRLPIVEGILDVLGHHRLVAETLRRLHCHR